MVEEKSPSFKLIVFSAETLNWRMPMVAAIYIYIYNCILYVCIYIYIFLQGCWDMGISRAKPAATTLGSPKDYRGGHMI